MLIHPSAEDIKIFHNRLIEIYEEEEFPVKIEPGYLYEGMIDYIADYAVKETLFGEPLFPHILQKAAVFLYYINSLHPFVDGNKRISLIITYYFLLWNGYYLTIPPDADKFLIKIARPELGLKLGDAYQWVIKHSKRRIFGILRNFVLYNLIIGGLPSPIIKSIIDIYLFMPLPKFVADRVRELRVKRTARAS